LKRKGLTDEGREALRQAALANEPWMHSTGPRTAQGKAASSANGKKRQRGPQSIRELRKELSDVRLLLAGLRDLRVAAAGPQNEHQRSDQR
jgi:hypothetical protein